MQCGEEALLDNSKTVKETNVTLTVSFLIEVYMYIKGNGKFNAEG